MQSYRKQDPITPLQALLVWSSHLDARLIMRDGDVPYLWRGYLGVDTEGCGAFLHRFVSSDEVGELHCHPWLWAASFILKGEYLELRANGTDVGDGRKILDRPHDEIFRPGMTNIIEANTFHRVTLNTPEVWTLFIHGPRVQPWGFVEEGVYGEPLPMRVIEGKTSDTAKVGNMSGKQVAPDSVTLNLGPATFPSIYVRRDFASRPLPGSCACDGSFDDGCWQCTPERHEHPCMGGPCECLPISERKPAP